MTNSKPRFDTIDFTGDDSPSAKLLRMVTDLQRTNTALASEKTVLAARHEEATRRGDAVNEMFEAALRDLELKTSAVDDLTQRCGRQKSRIRELERVNSQCGAVAYDSLTDGLTKLEEAHDAWILFLRFLGIDATDPDTLAEFDAWLKAELPEDGERISQTFSQRFQTAREAQPSFPETDEREPIASQTPPSPTAEASPFPRAAPPPRLHQPASNRQPTPAMTPQERKRDGRYSYVDNDHPLLAEARCISFDHLHSSKAPASTEPPASNRIRDSVDDAAITIEPAAEADPTDPDHPDNAGRKTIAYDMSEIASRTVH